MQVKHLLPSLCCFAVILTGSAQAQTKPAKPAAVQPAQKPKTPKLITSVGDKKDSVISLTAAEAVALIGQPLVVTDEKKTVYGLSSYQCMYKRKGVTEDESTGKVSPATSTVIQRFAVTPLSAIWRKTIGEELKTGEEIYFFDIVVKDAQNRLYFAPALKIVIR